MKKPVSISMEEKLLKDGREFAKIDTEGNFSILINKALRQYLYGENQRPKSNG